MRAGIFWNQTLSVLIDGLHNGRQNLCLDVRIIYSFQMTIHWETEYSIQYGNKSNRTSHTFLFVTRYYFAMHFNFHVKLKFDVLYTRCKPNTNNVFVNRARRSVWPEFDLFDDVLSSIIPPDRVTRKHWPPVRGPVQRTGSTDHLTDRSMDHLYGPPLLTP